MKNLFNIKSYFKFLSRNKAYTAIDVFGLSISIMFVIIIGVYYLQEKSIDQYHSKGDRIYTLGLKWGNGSTLTGGHWNLQSKLKDRYPEIENTCAVNIMDWKLTNDQGENVNTVFMLTDPSFYEIFDFPLIRGDRKTALDSPNKCVISEKLAKELFGNSDPIGKSIEFKDSLTLTISAIMGAMENTSLVNSQKKSAEMIVNFDIMKYINPYQSKESIKMENATGTEIFLLCKPGCDLSKKTDDIDSFFKTFFWVFNLPGQEHHSELITFNKLYFSDAYSSSGSHINGDKKMVNILIIVGLAILIFAIMNYINLTVAQAGFRAKEMATRRLLGSSRSDIILRLIIESTSLCIISLAIAIILAYAFAPYAGKLLDTDISINSAITYENIIILAIIILLLGTLSGIIPAMVISSAKPIDVVRGNLRRKTKMVLSKIFITFQNTITIIMIAASLTMILQIRHLINAPLGYDTENIINIKCVDNSKNDLFIDQIKSLPSVVMVSKALGTPFEGGNYITNIIDGKTVNTQVLIGDKNYMKIFGMELEKDNNIGSDEAAYINHQALAELNCNKDAEYINFYNEKITIRGILKEFHIRDIESEQRPVFMWIKKDIENPWSILIKIKGDPVKAYDDIKSIYRNIFNQDCVDENPFYDQMITMKYDRQIRLSKMVSLFAFIAIVISMMGIIAMSTYYIQQRSQEIAVRKVFGSSNKEILIKLIRTFMIYVIIAFFIAIPIIYYFMSNWLTEYNYRISLSWWIYAAAGLFCLIISFCAVFFQSYKAANSNPVDSIKNN